MGALGVILVVGGIIAARQKPLSLSDFDQPFYLGIASDLLATGRFTDGFMFDASRPADARGSGMRFAPLYPALLAAAAPVDPAMTGAMACVVATEDRPHACPADAPVIRAAQFLMLAGFLLLVWWMGGVIGGGVGMAWLTLLLALPAVPDLVRYAELAMTEMTSLLLATACIAAWLRSTAGPAATKWAAVAGVCLGLATLTKPAFLYLLPVWVMAAYAWVPRRRSAAFAAGALGVIAPWIARNWLVFGRFALTYGYDSHTLVQRIAFDTMTPREYGRSFVCWLPDGTGLGERLWGKGACDRFGWDDQPNSFYSLGLRHMLDETLREAGGYAHHMRYLIEHYLLAMPFWHLAVSVPLALRGAYVAHWWGFVLLAACIWATASARRWPRYLVMALPALFMLAFNAGVAVNQVRYNLLLVPAYAVAGALGIRAIRSRKTSYSLDFPSIPRDTGR